MVQNKFKYLVADTTAFINNVPLNEYAENIITVPDVVNEVKSKRQIRRLVVLPFDLQVQEPNAEILAYVTNFAKQTGDYASLSSIDTKVIALTYQLEKEHVGTEHLRTKPIVSQVVASKNKPEEFNVPTPLAGFYNPSKGVEGEDQQEVEEDATGDDAGSDEPIETIEESPENNQEDEQEYEITEDQLKACFEKLSCEPDDDDEDVNVLVPEKSEKKAAGSEDESEEDDTESDEEEEVDEDDDDTAWITPSNIQKVKKEMGGGVEDEIPAVVACMTTDFAIQNVLKQFNLNVAALNGRVIKNIRTYVLRCYACFKTTSIVSKIFCPNCGNKTLKRVAVSLDENGKQIIHINTRRPLTAKYKNQSLPRPRGGKHSTNPILVEDQPLPKQMPSRVAKTKTNALNEDYLAGYSPFVTRDIDSRSAMIRSKGNIKQWARNNVYEEERRRKSYYRFEK